MTAYEQITGIDNGLDGGIVTVTHDGTIWMNDVMPTVKLGKKREYDLAKLAKFFKGVQFVGGIVFIESAQPMRGQGVTSTFRTGYGFGVMVGMLAGLQIPYTVVRPQTWQRTMFAGLPAEATTKQKSVIVAQRLWPSVDWTRSERATKPHDGMTDAALIAEAGRRSLGMGVV